MRLLCFLAFTFHLSWASACVIDSQPKFQERVLTARNIHIVEIVSAKLQGYQAVYQIRSTQSLLGKPIKATELIASVGACGGVHLKVGLKYVLILDNNETLFRLQKSETRILPIEVPGLQDVSDDAQSTRLTRAIISAKKTASTLCL